MDGPWTHSRLRQQILQYHTTRYQWSALGPPLSNYRKAAVLVPLFLRDGRLYVWLTKRSNIVGDDKGDVCFPGGMKEDDDKDEVDTCLREAHEETGLAKEDVDIVGTYVPRLNRRNIIVSPVIGIVKENFQPKINEEVEFAFCLPLARFLSPENHRMEVVKSFRNRPWSIHFFTDSFEDKTATTFGETAHLCCEMAVALLQRPTEFQYSPRGKLQPTNPIDTFNNDFPEIVERYMNHKL